MVQSIFPSEEKFAQPNIFIFHRDSRGNLASGYTIKLHSDELVVAVLAMFNEMKHFVVEL